MIFFPLRATQEEDKYIAISRQLETFTRKVVNRTVVKIPDVDTHFNLSILGCAIVAVFSFGLLRAVFFLKVTLKASRNLHNSMFNSILSTTMQFFEKQSITG